MLINGLTVEVLPDDRLAEVAADHIASAISRRLAVGSSCSIAFSGGGTPNRMFEALARRPVDWSKVDIFQVDERLVPAGHPDHNFTALDEHLISRVPVPSAQVHPMQTDIPDPAKAAERYGRVLHERAPNGLTLVHLGLGDDGHTASWPPGDPVTSHREPVAVVGPYRGRLRMTLTPPVIHGAGSILWLVGGSGKAQALKQLVDGDSQIPAWHARLDGSVVLADEPAARLIQQARG